MSDFDERGRSIPDYDELQEAADLRRRIRPSRCLCGYPDWPGQCPRPANCPVHGEAIEK